MSKLIAVSRIVARILLVLTIVFEILCIPVLYLGIFVGLPDKPMAETISGWATVLLPVAIIWVLIKIWRKLEARRDLYPYAAGVLVVGWTAYVILAFVLSPEPLLGLAMFYSFLHMPFMYALNYIFSFII